MRQIQRRRGECTPSRELDQSASNLSNCTWQGSHLQVTESNSDNLGRKNIIQRLLWSSHSCEEAGGTGLETESKDAGRLPGPQASPMRTPLLLSPTQDPPQLAHHWCWHEIVGAASGIAATAFGNLMLLPQLPSPPPVGGFSTTLLLEVVQPASRSSFRLPC